MPKRNIELLTKVRDLVIAEPKKLDMNSWARVSPDLVQFAEEERTAKVTCGTTACIAGWAVQIHGYQLLVNDRDWGIDGHSYFADTCVAKNGRVMDVGERAQQLLGLTYDEADFLFLHVENEDAVKALSLFIEDKSLHDIARELYPGWWDDSA